MSDLSADAARWADLIAGMPQRVGSAALTQAQIPETYANVGLRQAETTKTQVETELDRISQQYGQMGLDTLKGGGSQQNYITDPARFGIPQSQMQPGAGDQNASVVPPAPQAPAAPAVPGGGSSMGAPSVTPPPPNAPAPPAVVSPTPQGPPGATSGVTTPGAVALSRYGPGSYQTADLSGTTSPPTAQPTAPPARPQGSVFLGQATSQPVPSPTGPPPASTTLQTQGGGQAPEYSPNSVNLPGIGPVPRVMAAAYFQAMMHGGDAAQALHTIMATKYARLTQLASQPTNAAEWQRNVLTAYNEGLISRSEVQNEWDYNPNKQAWLVRQFTDASTQSNQNAELATHGGAWTPQGIGPAAGPQGMIEGSVGAQAAGRGDTVTFTTQDPNDPTKLTTTVVPAPGAYEFMRTHPGAKLAPNPQPGPQSQNQGGGPDPVAGLPPDQARPMVAQRESGNQNIEGPVTRNADGSLERHSGYYQFADSTWQRAAAMAGLQNPPPRAIMASKQDQDAAFNALYAREGATPWAASNPNRGAPAPPRTAMAPQTQGTVGGGGPMGAPGGAPTGGFLASREAPPLGGVTSVAAAAAPPAPTRTAAAGNTYVTGDSIADGVRTAGNFGGRTTVGLNPPRVLTAINNTPASEIQGKDVVLSSGASNDGPNHPNTGLVTDQIQALKDKGAKSVTVLGVGPGGGGDAVNDQLAMAAGRAGAQFRPLTGPFTANGVHPTTYGPLARSFTTSQATPATPAGTQFAGPGVPALTPPAGGGATQAQYLGPGGPTQPIVGPVITTPGKGAEEAMNTDQGALKQDQEKEFPRVRDEANAVRNSIMTTDDIIHRLDAVGSFTGAGADFRKGMLQVLKDYGPDVINRIIADVGGDKFDVKNVDQVKILAKELFNLSTQQERGLTSVGGARLTELFGAMLPNIGMSGDAIRDMTNVFRVMQQANVDYTSGAMDHYNQNRQWAPWQRDPSANVGYKRYSPISEFETKFFDPNGTTAPRVYINAAGLMNGRDNWYSGMSKPQRDAAIAMAYKVDPAFELKESMKPPGGW